MKATQSNKTAQSNFTSMSASNPSILLDKLNARRSTPDSEALASSDDEPETHRQESQLPTVPAQKPARRASWLNDTTQPLAQQRKGSFASSSMSPTTSHPSTPSAESGTWGSHVTPSSNAGIGRGPSGSTSFPWGSGIWNSDSRKEPPSRLTEVLASPTSTLSGSNSNGFFSVESNNSQNHSISRDQLPDTTIPFAIPLHPTPKTYRSQSYSVGQLDPDSPVTGHNPTGVSGFNARSRALQHSGLQHRPSRPSMLSEMSSDGTSLGKVKEVEDDDDESTTGSAQGVQLQESHDQAKALEMLARENAILRQQNYHNSRLRSRSSTTGTSLGTYGSGGQYGIQDCLPEESDFAIDELDEISELQDITNKGAFTRRLSEYGTGQGSRIPAYTSLENRKLESVKKAYWQSSLGFGGLSEIPQSRRHSFADIPTRQGSVSSAGESLSARENRSQENTLPQDQHSRYSESASYQINDHGRGGSILAAMQRFCAGPIRSNYLHQCAQAVSYFGSNALQPRNPEIYAPSAYPTSVYQPYAMNSPFGGGRPSSPHRGMYTVPQPRHNQFLYIVLFKCSRADVFYVQEGTGLSVKPGDLVIVEADRGTDLGTVAQDNVDWSQAKELKEHYAEEHYKWLMMYSQGAAGTSDGTGAGLMAASNGLQGSAVGGMGPPSQHGMQEQSPGELKPKIIKRLAQNHEIQSLRDKEGNEAKAKRVCMQKVKEHGLHMEILDAEFQMDWKKLTFYYFADAYINFNSLVTDLFKVYKTRIWMSAINPASFASPSLGLQAPSGIGPGAVGVSNRPAQVERRVQQQEQPPYNNISQTNRGYQSGPSGSFSNTHDRSHSQSSGFPQPNFAYGYSAFAAAPRSAAVTLGGYVPNLLPQIDPFSTFAAPPDFQSMPAQFPSPRETGEFGRQGGGHPTANDSWMNSFQGLSLNTR